MQNLIAAERQFAAQLNLERMTAEFVYKNAPEINLPRNWNQGSLLFAHFASV
jgi:hypothetical protein